MDLKSCAFIGHRKIPLTEALKNEIYEQVENLIKNLNVTNFLFGTCSDFNTLCYHIVSDLKKYYPYIQKIVYTCKSETFKIQDNLDKNRAPSPLNHDFYFDKEVHFKTKWTAGKASYIERNQAMIDDSDYCIFYYDNSYIPSLKKLTKHSVILKQSTSGTKIAFLYAYKKHKIIINTYHKKNWECSQFF